MTIRLATHADVLAVVDMVVRLRESVGGPIAVDRSWTARTVSALIEADDGAVWISGGGFIAGSIRQTIISPAPVAVEHGWFASDGSGLRLLRAFEAWASARGAALIQISTGPHGFDPSRLGYRLAERAWAK